MMIIIKEHKHGSVEILDTLPGMTAGETVEAWQKATIHYAVHGTLPAVTWKVAEHGTLVDAMIESARLP